MRHLISAAAVVLVSGSFAFADSSNSNASSAKAMAAVLSGTPGIGGVAPTVSGKNASAPGDSGWGNAGSRLVVGTQVSGGK